MTHTGSRDSGVRRRYDNQGRIAHGRLFLTAIGVRSLVGIALLTRPRALVADLSGQPVDEKLAIYARILGARHLVEAAIMARWPTPTVVRTGAAVDAIHAASCLVLCRTDHHPRLAIVNFASASTFALLGAALARGLG